MAIYDTRYGLTQPIVNYLNQGLPSISGIFSNAPTTTTPVVDDTEDTPTGLTPEQLALLYPQNVGGGGDGFSVYNPDPNKTRTSKNYNSRPAYEAAFGTMMGDPEANIATGALNTSGVMGSYQERPPSGLATLLGKTIDFMPGVGTIKKGAQFLGNMLGGIMPVNRRAILENELLGKGVMLDDIGRIVSNDYNTPEGIMSGYNANQLTDKSFQDRIDNISETLSEKYGMTQEEIDQAISGTYTGTKGFNPTMGKTTNLIGNLNDLFNAKNIFNRQNIVADKIKELEEIAKLPKDIQQYNQLTNTVQQAIEKDNKGDQGTSGGGGFSNVSSNTGGAGGAYNEGNFCFDPSTPIQMADGSTKEIKNIQLGDDTKGGEVTGVFQFKASDEIHNYKGVTVAGSHYVKEDGRFIMVKDSPQSVKINKIPVVYSLDTSGRRIFINDIEFADYNGDGVAKNFLTNAGVDLTGFDTEVLRQVENRLI